jgi:hypothetical protein
MNNCMASVTLCPFSENTYIGFPLQKIYGSYSYYGALSPLTQGYKLGAACGWSASISPANTDFWGK